MKDGTKHELGLGSYPLVSLSLARQKRDVLKGQLALGEDPFTLRKQTAEKRRNSKGSSIKPMDCSIVLKTPFRPKKGIQEIMRMMFEVQNGIVQIRNKTICQRVV